MVMPLGDIIMSHAYVIGGEFTHAGYQISVEDVEMKKRFIAQARLQANNACQPVTVQQQARYVLMSPFF